MTRTFHGVAALAALLLAGCPRTQTVSGPVPVAMTPSLGTAVAALPVVITGQNFDAAVKADFKTGTSVMDAAFQARLLPEGGGAAVVLQGVTLTDKRLLQAQVPAGIPRGSYDLEVTDPAGRVGVLGQAFRVVTSAESVAGFKVDLVEPARAGVPFLVSLTAVDAQGLAVDGFADSVQVSDQTGTVTPASAGPFAFGRLLVRPTITALSAANRVTVADSLGHSGVSDPFPVQAGPAVAIAFASAPVTAAANACSPAVSLELRDAYGNTATASAAVDVQVQSSPPGSLAFFTGATCASSVAAVTVPAGATGIALYFKGAAAGQVEIRAVPAGLTSAIQGETVAP